MARVTAPTIVGTNSQGFPIWKFPKVWKTEPGVDTSRKLHWLECDMPACDYITPPFEADDDHHGYVAAKDWLRDFHQASHPGKRMDTIGHADSLDSITVGSFVGGQYGRHCTVRPKTAEMEAAERQVIHIGQNSLEAWL